MLAQDRIDPQKQCNRKILEINTFQTSRIYEGYYGTSFNAALKLDWQRILHRKLFVRSELTV